MRIAESLAKKDNCLALVTGESVGQVASQTLESISVVDEVAKMPVLRPLVGMDKIEITHIAQRYGTFVTSILPYQDCCTIFVPKHPVTKPRIVDVKNAEERIEIESLVDDAINNSIMSIIDANSDL